MTPTIALAPYQPTAHDAQAFASVLAELYDTHVLDFEVLSSELGMTPRDIDHLFARAQLTAKSRHNSIR